MSKLAEYLRQEEIACQKANWRDPTGEISILENYYDKRVAIELGASLPLYEYKASQNRNHYDTFSFGPDNMINYFLEQDHIINNIHSIGQVSASRAYQTFFLNNNLQVSKLFGDFLKETNVLIPTYSNSLFVFESTLLKIGVIFSELGIKEAQKRIMKLTNIKEEKPKEYAEKILHIP